MSDPFNPRSYEKPEKMTRRKVIFDLIMFALFLGMSALWLLGGNALRDHLDWLGWYMILGGLGYTLLFVILYRRLLPWRNRQP